MSARVVVTDHNFGSLHREQEAAATAGATLDVYDCSTEDDTCHAVRGAQVALVNFAPMTARVLECLAPGATVVRYGVGYDNVDVDAARRLGVAVANVPDYGVETVADHATACLLMLLRRIPQYDSTVKTKTWCKPSELGPLRGFASTTVGLLGAGRIGLAVVERLRPFGFTVIAHDPWADPAAMAAAGVTPVSLGELAATAHAISLHAPLTDATRHVIGRQFLASVQPGTVLVNTARGPLIDTEALIAAIDDGSIGGVALDATDPEPLPADSALRQLANVVITPHVGFYSVDSLDRLQQLVADEAARALRGEPLRSVVA